MGKKEKPGKAQGVFGALHGVSGWWEGRVMAGEELEEALWESSTRIFPVGSGGNFKGQTSLAEHGAQHPRSWIQQG